MSLRRREGSIIIFITLIIFIFNSSHAASKPPGFSYDAKNTNGPENWGRISQECGKGELQSPIDLSDKRVVVLPSLGMIHRSYKSSPAVIKSIGYQIMLQWEDAGGIRINGTKYKLDHIHWHSPSEHTINGRRYSLELHMVHKSFDEKIAVVAILYTIGHPDPFIAKLEDYVRKLNQLKEGDEEHVGVFDPRDIKIGNRMYYRYIGSLTVPPCTEGVLWSIVRKVQTVSREQVCVLQEALDYGFQMNARPLQRKNDRSIGLYRPHDKL